MTSIDRFLPPPRLSLLVSRPSVSPHTPTLAAPSPFPQFAGLVLSNATVAVDDPELRQCLGLWDALIHHGKGGDRWVGGRERG